MDLEEIGWGSVELCPLDQRGGPTKHFSGLKFLCFIKNSFLIDALFKGVRSTCVQALLLWQ
jgi:hypothetical protein